MLLLVCAALPVLAWTLLDRLLERDEQTLYSHDSRTTIIRTTTTNNDQQQPHQHKQQTHLTVFYASLKGRSEKLARAFAAKALELDLVVDVRSFAECDAEDLTETRCAVFVLATYENGTPPDECADAEAQLLEAARDFRHGAAALSNLHYAIFGCGNSEYARVHFNAFARRVDRALKTLGAKRVIRRADGDDIDNRLEEQFEQWCEAALPRLTAAAAARATRTAAAAAARAAEDTTTTATERDEVESAGEDDGDDMEGVVDVEDLASALVKRPAPAACADAPPLEMVSPALRKALTKQGYKVVGSHSGVKLCRWTKAMLRGRGGCYKHTFYGIESHRCMEATPSLACANKCVFCWRHHDNPVGTSFRWQVDEPRALLDGMEEGHKQMIKQMRGVPGVKPERFAEASKVRHCALSLVGEPIIYPRINEFLDDLHARRISSFMVTNAQFPAQMETLRPVTNLYISIDAPTKEQLKAVDRPLFTDFYERFLECVEQLRERRQRTTFRLTLVNGWNDSELGAYAALIRRGLPDFVEVKGVTYCGDSKASPLTIKHCPFHDEVVDYCRRLAEASEGEYTIASEHAHSNCVLLARRRFCRDGVWHTWIDYDKFHDLYASGEPFTSDDYVAPTPEWAVYTPGAVDGGFDPAETRVRRHRGGGLEVVANGGC